MGSSTIPAPGGSMEDSVVAAASQQAQRKPLLFISHRHADIGIANAVRDFISDRSGDKVRVFQSSSAAAEGPKFGKDLNEELARALWEASMVILIYTTPDHDWSYCMYECGLAIEPGTPDTRPILFQCGGGYPNMFAGEVRVNVRSFVDIQRFVNEFLTSPNFFPGYTQALTEFPPNSTRVVQAAQSFYDSLQIVLPTTEEKIIDQSWPYPFLRLELSREGVDRIKAETLERRVSTTTEALLDSRIIESDPELRRIFGRSGLSSEAKFHVLVDGWTEKFRQSQPAWLEALSEQVSAAVLGMFPTLRWELMRGVDDRDGTWYAPVVNYVCTLGGFRHMQFDVYFDKFEVNESGRGVKVGIPPLAPSSESSAANPDRQR
jgi:hypothetical protein